MLFFQSFVSFFILSRCRNIAAAVRIERIRRRISVKDMIAIGRMEPPKIKKAKNMGENNRLPSFGKRNFAEIEP